MILLDGGPSSNSQELPEDYRFGFMVDRVNETYHPVKIDEDPIRKVSISNPPVTYPI